MPLYSYRCPADHETTVLCRFDARPATTPCETCAAEATERPAAPAYTMGAVRPVLTRPVIREVGHALVERWCECRTCGKVNYDVVDDGDPLPTCACGGETFKRATACAKTETQNYPYFDQGLGCWITSKSHRVEEMRRQGVVEIGNEDAFIARKLAEEKAAVAKEDAVADAYLHDLEHHPKYREYREMRAKGMFDHHMPADPGPFTIR